MLATQTKINKRMVQYICFISIFLFLNSRYGRVRGYFSFYLVGKLKCFCPNVNFGEKNETGNLLFYIYSFIHNMFVIDPWGKITSFVNSS